MNPHPSYKGAINPDRTRCKVASHVCAYFHLLTSFCGISVVVVLSLSFFPSFCSCKAFFFFVVVYAPFGVVLNLLTFIFCNSFNYFGGYLCLIVVVSKLFVVVLFLFVALLCLFVPLCVSLCISL